MDQPRIGFCCTFVSPIGDEDEQSALNKNLASAQLAAQVRELEPA